MHADELSCLSFWLIADTERKGWLSFKEAEWLMQAFRFELPFTYNIVRRDFAFTNQKMKHEYNQHSSIIRFDFVREIFLERGL